MQLTTRATVFTVLIRACLLFNKRVSVQESAYAFERARTRLNERVRVQTSAYAFERARMRANERVRVRTRDNELMRGALMKTSERVRVIKSNADARVSFKNF